MERSHPRKQAAPFKKLVLPPNVNAETLDTLSVLDSEGFEKLVHKNLRRVGSRV